MQGIWNGRFDVWNGTNLLYSILACFDMVLLKSHVLTWCCWSPVFLSVEHISRQSLSSTRTVIRKLRAFFVISVTNSNVDAKRTYSDSVLMGTGEMSPDFCMFTSVLPACHCARRDSYLASIASNLALKSKTWPGILWLGILWGAITERETIIALCKRAIKACLLAVATSKLVLFQILCVMLGRFLRSCFVTFL